LNLLNKKILYIVVYKNSCIQTNNICVYGVLVFVGVFFVVCIFEENIFSKTLLKLSTRIPNFIVFYCVFHSVSHHAVSFGIFYNIFFTKSVLLTY